MRAQDPGILELTHPNNTCALSYMSVYNYFLILVGVQEMIRFMSNAFAVESDATTPPSTCSRHNVAGVLSLIYLHVICDTPEQMSGGVIHILNTCSPPHLPYPAYPSFL